MAGMTGFSDVGTRQVIAGNVADLAEVGAAAAWAWQVVEEWAPPPAGSTEAAQRAQLIARLRGAAAKVRGLAWASDGPATVEALRVVAFEDGDRVLTIRCHGRDEDEAHRLCTRMVLVDQPGERGFAATAAVQNELRRFGWQVVTTGSGRSTGLEWSCAQHAAQLQDRAAARLQAQG